MDPVTVLVLIAAVVFVIVVVLLLPRSKAPAAGTGGFTESELAALSSGKRDKRKQPAKKSPANRPSQVSPPKPRAVSGKLKNVDGATDEDTDAHMLAFLERSASLEQRRSTVDDVPTDDKPRAKKSHEPAEKPAAGFTAVVDKKKAPKKDAEEPAAEEKKEDDDKKKRSKPFYKDELEAIKKEQELRKAEREKESKERATRSPRPPRENGEVSSADTAGGEARKERKPRPPGEGSAPPARPKREVPPVLPLFTEPFEEWSIDSMLDSITANPVADKPRAKRPTAQPAAAASAVSASDSSADPAQD